MNINPKTAHLIARTGPWTAMAIKLPDGTYTRAPAVDHRLKRIVQCAQDLVRKSLSECRVLDLACLEGHYAIEFALHGAEALGIEGRQVNVDKCNYAKEQLGLERLSFVTDDVRNLSTEKYGTFDIVICSGILYHMKEPEKLIASVAAACTGVLILDTFISLYGRETVNGLRGHSYFEHEEEDSESMRSQRLWASLDNASSFWLTEPSLVNLLSSAGFTSVVDVLYPAMLDLRDRKTYIAVKGKRARIRSSDPTDSVSRVSIPEGINPRMDASQFPRGTLHRVAKRVLPQSVKNAIKPALRAVRILPPDGTPEFMKKS